MKTGALAIAAALMVVPTITAAAQDGTAAATQAAALPKDLVEAQNLVDLTEWARIIELTSDDYENSTHEASALALRAIAFTRTNRVDLARADLVRAVALAPDKALRLAAQGVQAERTGDEDLHREKLRAALAIEPRLLRWAHVQLAWNLYRAQREEEALAAADDYIAAFPEDRSVAMMKGQLLVAMGRADDAVLLAESLTANKADDLPALYAAADIHASLGNYDVDRKMIDQVVAATPDYFYPYYVRSGYHPEGDHAAKKRDLELALERNAGWLEGIAILAQTDFDLGNWAEAVQGFSVILPDEPLDHGVLLYRGMAFEKLGQLDRALKDYDAATEATRNAGDLSFLCLQLAFEQTGYVQTREMCDAALAQAPDEAQNHSARAVLNLRTGDLVAAGQDAEAAIVLDERSSTAHYVKALLLWRGNQQDAAMKSLERALEFGPQTDEMFRHYGIDDLPRVER
ncbi:tetratricopeptide repeat protein [Erythrobacteraceae bacterium WH01K]|nr:tetratricopeptide repeat protein [Erythrobacteraceae bacterium WH01K]